MFANCNGQIYIQLIKQIMLQNAHLKSHSSFSSENLDHLPTSNQVHYKIQLHTNLKHSYLYWCRGWACLPDTYTFSSAMLALLLRSLRKSFVRICCTLCLQTLDKLKETYNLNIT